MNDNTAQQIATLTALLDAGALDRPTYAAAVTALQRQATYTAEAKEGSAVAQDHSIALAAGATFNYYQGEPTDDPLEALQIYRRVLLGTMANLPLRGVDVGAGDPATARQLGLANVYVDLDTTALIGGETETGEVVLPGQSKDVPVRRQELLRLPALQAVAGNRQLVLTGEPGGGKSTFANHLAYCLAAHALHPDAGWLDHLPGWPAAEATLLPIPVTLRDFAVGPDAGKKAAAPSDLWQFIAARLGQQNLGFAARAVEAELWAGRAIVLLDGLDEVTGDDRRAFVRDAVAAFASRYGSNRFLVTCRIPAYQPPDEGEPDLRLDTEKFPVFELAPFDEEKIDRFLAAWYAELSRLGSVRVEDVESLVARLRAAVRRPDLWRMAPNPLLLTVMALVHAHQGRLPDARALLYEQTVDMLLWRWEEVKLAGGGMAPTLRHLLSDAGRAELDLKRALWRLAFEAHGRSGDGDDALGDIAEAQLTRALVKLKPDDWQWAHEMVAAMKLRAGLLLERSPGVFTFPHRTFQEYLAGAHLSTQSDCAQRAVELGKQGALWREAILLAAGRLVHVGGDVDRALALVNRLCPERPRDDEAGWRNVWLAGDALREIGLTRVRDDEDSGRPLLERLRRRLAALVGQGQLAPRERVGAGNTLAELGDPRPGIGVRVAGGVTIPDIELCYVPPGPFWMGSPDDDRDARNDERPSHLLDVPYGYWIGRYPVTVAQWRAFCAAAGYSPRDPDSLDGAANQPAIWIAWYDAMAFGRQLTAMGHAAGWLPRTLAITLPSEAEWEKAARGGLRLPASPILGRLGDAWPAIEAVALVANEWPRRRFPWGDEPADPSRANFDQSGIRRVSSAGAFPAGAGPYGTLDLSGNVWEWTRSRYKGYPYDPADGREGVETVADRNFVVMRGGAYYSNPDWLRCAYRDWDGPDYRLDGGGFRVVVSPFLPPLVSDGSDL